MNKDQTGFPFAYHPSPHETAILSFFGEPGEASSFEQLDAADDNPSPDVFICFCNRSGSNFLAEALANTGLVSHGGEFFNAEFVIDESKKHGIKSFLDYCAYLKRTALAAGRPFCSKVSWQQLYFLFKCGAIAKVFRNARFVYVQRHDILGQAISFSIAEQTRKWTSLHSTEMEVPNFNLMDITERVRGIIISDFRFRAFFSLTGISALTIYYEDMESDLRAEIVRAIDFLKLDSSRIPAEISVALKKQRNQRNELFKNKIVETYRNLVWPPSL